MRHYLTLWKRTFDYKGVSTRQEYRVPLIVTALLAALTAVLWIVGSVEYADVLMGAGVVTGALFALHVIPMMALTVRRLRDAGKKPWLAVLSCLAGIGTVIVMLVCLLSVSATGELPLSNINTCVVQSVSELPIRNFMEQGIRVTINTDNMSVSSTDIKNELKKTVKAFGFGVPELKTLLVNSVAASFADDTLKEKCLKKIEDDLNKYL